MKPDGWWKEVDNFLATDSWESDSRGAKALGPTVWLQHTNEQMRLCVFQYRTVTLIMLVPINSSVNGLDGLSLLRGQLLEKVCTSCRTMDTCTNLELKRPSVCFG
jgi:hypothetical protein